MKRQPNNMQNVSSKDVHEIERAMLASARRAVFGSTVWMTIQEVSPFLGRPIDEAASILDHWKLERRIFSVDLDGVDIYPEYCFTKSPNPSPRPELKPALEILATERSGFGIAMWLISVNGYLGGVTPLSALDKKSAKLAAAAEAEIAGILHG
jgi:hypothetical protein